MNNYTVNFTTPEASTNSTTHSFGSLYILEMCLHSINFLFVLPTHSYVLWLIITGTGNGVAIEFVILNLSGSEIGTCLNSLISILSFWCLGLLTLKQFLIGLIITGRPLFQCLICVERYLAVVHPVTFLKYKPLRYRVICSTVVWITGLGSCLLCTFVVVSSNKFMWFSFLQFLLFLSIQLFCLVAVLRALKQSGPGEKTRGKEEENPLKRRAFKIIVILTVTMLIVVVPFIISRFLNILLQKDIEEVSVFSLWCFVLGGFVPALLFLRRVGKLPFFRTP